MFNVRVYGILRDERNRVLVSDERIRGKFYTKFPGGGLEFGEGTRACIVREFKEETGLDVTCGNHIYTTDFFQVSAFNPAHQIISIYYFVEAPDGVDGLVTSEKENDFSAMQMADTIGQYESFRWIEWPLLTEESVTLPIDKVVVKLLKDQYTGFFSIH
jgi:8-oxo-dGTP diphosphatase